MRCDVRDPQGPASISIDSTCQDAATAAGSIGADLVASGTLLPRSWLSLRPRRRWSDVADPRPIATASKAACFVRGATGHTVKRDAERGNAKMPQHTIEAICIDRAPITSVGHHGHSHAYSGPHSLKTVPVGDIRWDNRPRLGIPWPTFTSEL